MKKSVLIASIIVSIAFICLLLALNYYENQQVIVKNTLPALEQTVQEEKPLEEVKPVPLPPGIKAENFSGLLEEVNVGCFADAECYVKVDGKHITVIIGRNSEVVGSVVGVDGFGDLEKFVGEKVDVYAQNKGDGFYSLYGSEEFYIKLSNSIGLSVRMNESKTGLGLSISPIEVLEDSRCPIDVVCIQAGTLRLQAKIETELGLSEQVFVLNEPVTTEDQTITLVGVEPISDSKTKIDSSEYNFMFKIVSE